MDRPRWQRSRPRRRLIRPRIAGTVPPRSIETASSRAAGVTAGRINPRPRRNSGAVASWLSSGQKIFARFGAGPPAIRQLDRAVRVRLERRSWVTNSPAPLFLMRVGPHPALPPPSAARPRAAALAVGAYHVPPPPGIALLVVAPSQNTRDAGAFVNPFRKANQATSSGVQRASRWIDRSEGRCDLRATLPHAWLPSNPVRVSDIPESCSRGRRAGARQNIRISAANRPPMRIPAAERL
jgi:hypothetical protein